MEHHESRAGFAFYCSLSIRRTKGGQEQTPSFPLFFLAGAPSFVGLFIYRSLWFFEPAGEPGEEGVEPPYNSEAKRSLFEGWGAFPQTEHRRPDRPFATPRPPGPDEATQPGGCGRAGRCRLTCRHHIYSSSRVVFTVLRSAVQAGHRHALRRCSLAAAFHCASAGDAGAGCRAGLGGSPARRAERHRR